MSYLNFRNCRALFSWSNLFYSSPSITSNVYYCKMQSQRPLNVTYQILNSLLYDLQISAFHILIYQVCYFLNINILGFLHNPISIIIIGLVCFYHVFLSKTIKLGCAAFIFRKAIIVLLYARIEKSALKKVILKVQ